METPHATDPFREARTKSGILNYPFQGENIPMILRHADVRAAVKDWETFSSDAPFRVPIPSEEDVRSMRQLPIETDPPRHNEYRNIVELDTKEPDSNCLEPGIYLATTYSHRTYRPTTIGAAAFHFRVRNGTGWFHRALVTRGQPCLVCRFRLTQGWFSGELNLD